MLPQRTLRHPIRAVGLTLHSGRRARIALHPAPEHTGVVFRRTDLPGTPLIRASRERVVCTRMCTTLGHEGATVATVEHLLAACSGLALDNVVVDVDGPELPIMDGSANPFVFLIQSAGVVEQHAPKQFVRIRKTVRVAEGDKWAKIEPFHGFRVAVSIAFDHPLFPPERCRLSLDFGQNDFLKEVSRARTFGFLRDLEALHGAGLAQGASAGNAVVLDDYRAVNEEGLRYPDEFVRHKALDAVGDLYLFGRNLLGSFQAHKPGHALNHALLQAVLADEDAWELIDFPERAHAPAPYCTPAHSA